MAEKKQEGSRLVLNGQEVFVKRTFQDESGIVYQTVDDQFIFPDCQPVKDRAVIEAIIQEPHRSQALAWWEKNYGEKASIEALVNSAPPPPPLEVPGPGKADAFSMILERLQDMAALQAEMASRIEALEETRTEPSDSRRPAKRYGKGGPKGKKRSAPAAVREMATSVAETAGGILAEAGITV